MYNSVSVLRQFLDIFCSVADIHCGIYPYLLDHLLGKNRSCSDNVCVDVIRMFFPCYTVCSTQRST